VDIVGFLTSFVFFCCCWNPELGIHFLNFPLNPILNYLCVGGKNGFHPFFFFPLLLLVLCNYVLDRLVGVFSHLFSIL
jgi:hypothetical protein